MNKEQKSNKKNLYASAIVAGIIVLCCVTPLLVILFAGVGLAVLLPYLDYLLFPTLGLFILLTVYFYKKWKQDCKKC